MAIVEMKRIDLLAMRQDQRKLLRTLQDMGCVEITPLQDEALAEYRTRDDGRLEQVDALLARLSWVIHECAAYNQGADAQAAIGKGRACVYGMRDESGRNSGDSATG